MTAKRNKNLLADEIFNSSLNSKDLHTNNSKAIEEKSNTLEELNEKKIIPIESELIFEAKTDNIINPIEIKQDQENECEDEEEEEEDEEENENDRGSFKDYKE